jgi:2-oxoglutarate dehydrogenase E1 component
VDDALSPQNLPYIEELYAEWVEGKGGVPAGWGELFRSLDTQDRGRAAPTDAVLTKCGAASEPGREARSPDLSYTQSRFNSLLWAYRDVGYLYARLNPLVGYLSADLHFLYDQEENLYERLTLREFGLGEKDLDAVLTAGRYLEPRTAPLREHLKALRETYCSTVGIEFLHIQNRKIRNWIIEQVETSRNRPDLAREEKLRILRDLVKAEEFEQFLHSTFIGQRRFSLEGAEVLIPALHHLVDGAAALGVEEIVLGMSHRGRLNVIANVLDKPISEIFSEFEDTHQSELYGGSGDVKYHKGYRCDHVNADGRRILINLVSNPSHLESVDPVVEGVARGGQQRRGDAQRRRVMPVLVHGDAAFSGQGVVPETLNLSRLRGYSTGGTVHFIVNNQIGFTTSTKDARSTFFPTDVAKMLPIPIFHVNGEDPEAVVHVTGLALKFRHEFARDVIVDIFCYRKHGHNEGDEPSFTHPKMYQLIRYHEAAAKKYGETLEERGETDKREREAFRLDYRADLKERLAMSRDAAAGTPSSVGVIEAHARGGRETADISPPPAGNGAKSGGDRAPGGAASGRLQPYTAVPLERISKILDALVTVPEGFHIHPKLERIVKEREKRFKTEGRVDFPLAEAFAFGSLLLDGVHVRLSGEDSARGTFSQRHSVWWDTESEKPLDYTPLNCITPDQAVFSVYDSPLSEFSLLGFEYGYSISLQDALVLWEAQFGDFSNGAQVVIDNFIASGYAKWGTSSGLVMLLPHGYEGQGPEHSSAHLERYLQLCAENNIRVCNATTPAQYFHLLRRQAKSEPKSPLIVMTPKSLLRHPRAMSPIADFTGGSVHGDGTAGADTSFGTAGASGNSRASFSEVIEDPVPGGETSAVCFCSGKIYYDLRSAIDGAAAEGIKLVRLEQLYPFPRDGVEAALAPRAEVCWVQEEPRNRGAWTFILDRFTRFMGIDGLRYIGREEGASTATGSHGRHAREQEAIVREVLEMRTVKGVTKARDGSDAAPAPRVSRDINNGVRSSHEP